MLLPDGMLSKVTLQYFTKIFSKLLLSCIILFYATIAYSQPYKMYSAEELIENIIAIERKIKDIQLHMTCTVPDMNNRVFYDFDWGYEGGKEFWTGQKHTLYKRFEAPGLPQVHTETKAFDGEKSCFLRLDPRKGGYPSGKIGSLDPEEFRGIVTPTTLLGFDAKELSRQSFGEAIAEAETVAVGKQIEYIDGHACYVLEATNVEVDPMTKGAYDVRAWIDTQRGFRPLKIEKCQSVLGENRWKVLSRRIDKIKLKLIDGIWFPVEGERTTFSVSSVRPPEGMTQEQFDELSVEERQQVGIFACEPMVPTRRLEIQEESIRINKGIPSERFTIKFPVGCRLWDEFTQMGYIVGGGDQEILESVTLEDDTKKYDSTPKGDLIDTTNTVQPGAKSIDSNEDRNKIEEDESSQEIDVTEKLHQPRSTIYLMLPIAILVVLATLLYFFKFAGTKRWMVII